MQETLKMLNSVRIEKYEHTELEELVLEYKLNMDPSVFAEVFVRVFGLSNKIIRENVGVKFVQEDIVVSSFLQILDKTMQVWEPGKGTKYSSYFGRCFRNKLFTEIKKSNFKHTKLNTDAMSVEDELSPEVASDFQVDTNLDISFSLPRDLEDRERVFCEMIVQGYTKIEIAQQLGVSAGTLRRIVLKLQNKIPREGLIYGV